MRHGRTAWTGGKMRGDVPESAHNQDNQKNETQWLHGFLNLHDLPNTDTVAALRGSIGQGAVNPYSKDRFEAKLLLSAFKRHHSSTVLAWRDDLSPVFSNT